MRSERLYILAAACTAVLLAPANFFASPAQTLNLPDPAVNNSIQDDSVPEVTARVARISFIRGDVQIRRADAQDWERATLNLPIVEGDEITTARDSRIEIQFDRYTHLRLDENAYITVVKLMDEGIAISLPQGTMSVRLNQFDKDRSYFEIDAPGSTVAAQRSGTYRIDAGDQDSSEIRISAFDDGEARIYSESNGFTLKSGRTARVFVTGNNAGEWDTADAAWYADEFDRWALDRDETIARSMQNAYYDKYYDNDIYGAEDLNGYGDWVYTRNYGYVWRPYYSAISGYSNWSPYRYGQWRWIPPYGWTWINDEPWGWATYHHGRWFYDAGYWYWSPYGSYRLSRSWWSPALVVITTYMGNICWYPLPYDYGYYNYNWYYYSQPGWPGGHHNGGHQGGGRPGGGAGGTTPTPTPPVVAGGPLNRPRGPKVPPLGTVPPTGVVTVPADDFGRLTKGTRTPPLAVANSVLSKIPQERSTTPTLPVYKDLKARLSRDILAEKPRVVPAGETVKTGAATRKTDAPLDQELLKTRILGGRPPLQTTIEPSNFPTVVPGGNVQRKTGGVERPPLKRDDAVVTKPADRKVPEETQTPQTKPRYEPPTKVEPRYVPPVRQDPPTETKPRYVRPPRQETPRYDPPPRRDPPMSKPTPTPRVDPPKSEPKPQKKPPMESVPTKKKDG